MLSKKVPFFCTTLYFSNNKRPSFSVALSVCLSICVIERDDDVDDSWAVDRAAIRVEAFRQIRTHELSGIDSLQSLWGF